MPHSYSGPYVFFLWRKVLNWFSPRNHFAPCVDSGTPILKTVNWRLTTAMGCRTPFWVVPRGYFPWQTATLEYLCIHNFISPTLFRFKPSELQTPMHHCPPVYTGESCNQFLYTAGTSDSGKDQYATLSGLPGPGEVVLVRVPNLVNQYLYSIKYQNSLNISRQNVKIWTIGTKTELDRFTRN